MADLARMWLTVAVCGASSAIAAVGGSDAVPRATPLAATEWTTSLADYARQFDDPRLEIREASTRRLIDDPSIPTDEIVQFIDTQWQTLAPESIERFMLVSRERYIANPGAIGIQFNNAPITTIDTVIPGTPAAAVLRSGDQFLSLNGHALPMARAEQQPELLRLMAGLKAGDLVQARIRRGREELDVEFALADPRGLPRFEDFIVQMQREMLQQWNALRERRFPANPSLMIDMSAPGVGPGVTNPGSAAGENHDARLIEGLNRRRAEVSQSIARVMEQSSAMDSPQRRRELEAEYLPLINEFAQLNARLRLLEAATSGRRRR